ncbi:MAG TPA: hypothetical protein VK789_13240 [Bryobacteraceae bacterium]|jgi:hypothetical protein|nr:hypothetical protein [Bryobacteraceae bacterium]
MKSRFLIATAGVVLAALCGLSIPVSAQFPADSTLPRNKRSKKEVAKFAPGATPRTKDGKPDLSGVWGYAGYTSDIAKDYDIGEVPMTPLADKLFKERQANEGIYDPEARCQPTGVPRRDPYPSKLIQEPNLLVILFEGSMHSYRQIFLDRTSHPKDPQPTWFGDSIGHWEGDELVVDTTGFNGKTWLDLAGHPASEQLHVIERYSRPQFGELKLDITIEDPVMYTKSWKVTERMPLMVGTDLMEYVCTENERDVRHLVPGEK